MAVAAISRLVGAALQLGLETALALGLGLAIGTIATIRRPLVPGATIAARHALRLGIALLGARLTIGQLLATGAASIAGIIVVVVTALAVGTWLARRLGLVPPLSALVTVGMAICGNSAILALSPIVGAKHRDTAYAVSTITVFGLIGVLSLPVVGRLLGLPDAVFGTWAGLAVNDTAQVVATGYAYSPSAGDVATVVKLTRNLAILPVLIGAAWWAARSSPPAATKTAAGRTSRTALVGRAVPWFVVGFVIVAGLRTAGILDVPVGTGTLADLCSTLAAVLILVALAGVGMTTDLRSLRAVGGRPFVLASSLWVLVGLLALLVAILVGSS